MSTNKLKLKKRLDDIVKMRTVLHPKDWKHESQLMMTRWFDYRFMSPMEATLLFGELYVQGLRRHVKRHVDVEIAETVMGIKEGAPASRARWFTSLWRARQRTDQIFVPYDLLIDFSFDFSSRRKRFWTMLPSQLHASAKNKKAWWAVFLESVEDQLPLRMRRVGDMPHYRIENDLSLPPQEDFRELIISETLHENRTMSDQLAERVFAKRHLTLKQGLDLVSRITDRSEVVARARSSFEDGTWASAPVVALERADLLPSCFGIAETIDNRLDPCRSCPLAAKCADFADRAISMTIRTAGSASPVLESERARILRNVKNFRSNKGKSPAEVSSTAEA
ncbi:hypothetical protein [Phyllobacterium endophyticum]|uniref:hypothetical protein n=1 Tax=Phyllobacterium endophyticum TaxID=1149773 RepID=UPI0011CA065B|nr:hypothetical protein [Phyllobacterium endophyticum]TXR50085.1 hypothetical protein FVA77_06785 [Phyllobacterium endophyticum]